jgi:hypothetical protein
MQIGLKQLIKPELNSLLEESRQFYETRKVAEHGKKQPDISLLYGD